MDELEQKVKALENGRANDMDALEHQNEEMKNKVNELKDTVETLKKEINNLRAQVADIKGRLQLVETAMDTKQSTVFGVKTNTNEDLTDNTWKTINTCERVFTKSPCFQENNCLFKAPIKGDYYMDMGVRQQGDGGLEVAFNGKGTGSFKHAYVGNTHGDSQVCHKTVIVSLEAGDVVFGIVRRMGGEATINWCSFHGCLISGDVTATTASVGGATGGATNTT